MSSNPTKDIYDPLEAAYRYFNETLFGGKLPHCVISIRNHGRASGYFAGGRFGDRSRADITDDEIALNPKHFLERSDEEILSTMVHEMVHQEQHRFGKPSRNGYHNRQWGAWMDRIGLTPSDTGKPGGRRTGQRMSHYIVSDGPFARAFAAQPFDVRYFDRQRDRDTQRNHKPKYTCPDCGFNVWANRPDRFVVCGDCQQTMICDRPTDTAACSMRATPVQHA